MSRKKQVNQKITALYCHISLDDGYTGCNFNRPAFQRMIADIEVGKSGCGITKNLSRLGRKYIEVGRYIEIFFPKHNVRYIAITNGVDSLTRQEMDITPFKNILNDMYSRDISKKVLARRMTRSRQGKLCGGQPPLGLMRDTEDWGPLIYDLGTGWLGLYADCQAANGGQGSHHQSKRKYRLRYQLLCVRRCKEQPYPAYPLLRVLVWFAGRTRKGFAPNTYDIILREDREIIDGCHKAIVTPEEWAKVQELIDRRPTIMQGNTCPFYNLFYGIIYWAICGKFIQVRYEKVCRTGKNRFTGEMREPIDKAYYIYQTYNRLGKNACTSHKIEARDLYNLVLKDIQELAAMALKDADAFYQRLSSRMERRYMEDASEMQKERERLEARNREIDDMVLSLYTVKAKGVLSE